MTTKIECFEDLIAWQKARDLTRAIYLATRQEMFARDLGLADQIQRAVVSIMSNIAEGFECGGCAAFFQCLTIAKASCAQVRSYLYIAFDVEYLDLFTFEDLLLQTEEVARLVTELRSIMGQQY